MEHIFVLLFPWGEMWYLHLTCCFLLRSMSRFHLTLMLIISGFHSAPVLHSAAIQASHTVCSGGDSGTPSLPSSSSLSCKEKNLTLLFIFYFFNCYLHLNYYVPLKPLSLTHTHRLGLAALRQSKSGFECFSWRNDIITNWSSFEFWKGNNMLVYGVAMETGPLHCKGMWSAAGCWG